MAINFDQDRSGLLGINNNNNINSNQMAFLGDFFENMFSGDPTSIQIGEENSPIDKAKDALEKNKKKSLPTPEEIEGKTSFLNLPSNNLTAMAISNYDQLFGPQTVTDAFGVNRSTLGLDRPDINTGKFNVNEVKPDGITKNVRFRDMLLQDLKNLPSDFKTSLGTVKEGLAEDFSGLKDFATNLKNKGIDLFGSGKELAFKGIGSLLAGPIGSFIGGALANLKETPEQKIARGLYDLDDTGTVKSGLMAGYNPVSAFGPTGLSGAMIDRITNIDKTLNNKVISNKTRQVLEARKAKLEAKIAAEQKAMQDYNREQKTGGYQSDFAQDKDFMEGKGTAAEMGSFRYGGIASL
mgnify:CR=1 FL=1